MRNYPESRQRTRTPLRTKEDGDDGAYCDPAVVCIMTLSEGYPITGVISRTLGHIEPLQVLFVCTSLSECAVYALICC
jgi:hypothetical protein